MPAMTDMQSLADQLNFLGFALTRREHVPVAYWMGKLLEGQEYYLPDGGYSRIVVSLITNEARLTSNSLKGPKEAWGNCKELVGDLEALVLKIRESLESS